VDETVALAHKYGHPGTAGLVNAVLRRLPEALAEITFPDPSVDLVSALGVFESHPDWIVRRWLERYGREETEALLRANNRPATVTIRVNRRRTHPQALARLLRRHGVTALPGNLSPYCLRLEPGAPVFTIPAFHAGLFTVQDEAESLVVPLLNPRPGERILDLCAGPGGKLGHILEWSRGEAHVVGVEIAPSRLRKVREMLVRLGEQADLVVGDGRQFGRPGTFDRVLVDAPCSGLGVLRRRADARWRKTPDLFAEMVPLQAELLDRAAELTRAAGVLVYSVCSFEPEECGQQVAKFLARHPDWILERPGPGIDPAAVNQAGCLEVRHDPWDTDGVFAARFRRPAGIPADQAAGRGEWEDDALLGDPSLAPPDEA
jgi:16S rRNA (cytosine967-C5)-methyltransferase